MPKKNFKGSPALSYINQMQEETTKEAAQPTAVQILPVNEKKGRRQKSEFWRVCLNLRPEFETYVKDEAWKARKDVTTYINDLIAADMDANRQAGE